MSTIAFLNFPATGHINRTRALITELTRRGETVVYYALEEFRPAVEATGANFRSYGEDMPLPSDFFRNQHHVVNQMMRANQWVLDHKLDEFRALQPDFVLGDALALWSNFAAQILKVPYVSTIPILMPGNRTARSTFWKRLRNQLIAYRDVRDTNAIAATISAKYGVRKPKPFEVFSSRGALNLVFTSRLFQPYADTYDPDRYKFVGATLQPRPDAPEFPFERLDPAKPLIYISFGTLFNNRPDFYWLCAQALADSGRQIVISVGKQVSPQALGALPDNVIARPYVPQLELLARAALFITHAGLNSVNEALLSSVPMLVLPQGADQVPTAQRVEELGAGMHLSEANLSADSLRSAVETVLAQPSYRQAAARLGDSLREAGGAVKAADEIEAFKRANGLS